MAATIQSLFPFTKIRANDFTVYPVYCKFSAPIIGGKYIFSEKTTPPQEFGELLQPQTGIIAGVMISANCSSDEFTSALDEQLFLQILHGGNGTPVNMAPFPFSSFAHGDNFQLQWEPSGTTPTQEEKFYLQIQGEVNQLTGMTQNELVLKVAFNYYRVGTDQLKKSRGV